MMGISPVAPLTGQHEDRQMTKTYDMPAPRFHDGVENPSAWEAGAKARIRANANKGRRERWFAEVDGAERAYDFLMEGGEFEPVLIRVDQTESGEHEGVYRTHPLVKASLGDFFGKMYSSIIEWGALTRAQTEAVLKMIDRAQQRIEERQAKRAEDNARSSHVGKVGERIEIVADVTVTFETESVWGFRTHFILRDDQGNVFKVATGSFLGTSHNGIWRKLAKGDRVQLIGTVKSHGEYQGCKQTVLQRCKVKAIVGAGA
jgi:hypothetical protein